MSTEIGALNKAAKLGGGASLGKHTETRDNHLSQVTSTLPNPYRHHGIEEKLHEDKCSWNEIDVRSFEPLERGNPRLRHALTPPQPRLVRNGS